MAIFGASESPLGWVAAVWPEHAESTRVAASTAPPTERTREVAELDTLAPSAVGVFEKLRRKRLCAISRMLHLRDFCGNCADFRGESTLWAVSLRWIIVR